jgi:fatty acid desaturase
VFTVILSVFILGGKHLACAILMHDAGHFSVFNNPKVNDFFGTWFGAALLYQNLDSYRKYHNIHHLKNGLKDEDPDVKLTEGYATTKWSMVRKFTRDLIGVNGLKNFAGIIVMNMGFIEYNLGNTIIWIDQKGRPFSSYLNSFKKNMLKPIIANTILWAILYFTASGWLYLLWFAASVSTFHFVLRVRSIAEHAVVPDSTDPLRNTRTTYANFFTRLFFAPYNVNYHAEHHLIMGVPSYNLKKMHTLIKKKGFYEKGILAPGYWSVIKLAASK